MNVPIYSIDECKKFQNCSLTFGHFNSVHPGHVRFLRKAALRKEPLVVAVLPDTKDGLKRSYKFSQKERAEGLASFGFIDAILLLKDEPFAFAKSIDVLNPNSLTLGTEFKESKDPEIIKAIEKIKKNGGVINFDAGEIQYATTDLLYNSGKYIEENNKKKFKLACKKQNIHQNKLLEYIDSWENTKILVIGDSILDQFVGCEALGMSAEAPVLVVRELQKKEFMGGASIVASHIKALGADCNFLSVLGDDDTAKKIKKELVNQGIKCHFIKDSSRSTTFKKRYVVENQKLFRVSRLNDHFLNKSLEDKLIKKVEKLAPNLDGIVISDFSYGVVTPKIVEKVVQLSKKFKFKLYGDSQCSSQIGLITKFKKFTLLCPNEKEARIALQDKESGLEVLSRKLIDETHAEMLIMKLGAKGFIAYDPNLKGVSSQSFPALSANPLDVSGAGDSLLALMAIALSSKRELMLASALACCISAIAVENMGNKPIFVSQIKEYLKKIL